LLLIYFVLLGKFIVFGIDNFLN